MIQPLPIDPGRIVKENASQILGPLLSTDLFQIDQSHDLSVSNSTIGWQSFINDETIKMAVDP